MSSGFQYAGEACMVSWSPYIQAKTIAFVEGGAVDTITDSASGFVNGGFRNSDEATVSGASDGTNNQDITITTAIAGTLTLNASDDLANESAGALVTIVGKSTTQHDIGSLHNFTINKNCDKLETSALKETPDGELWESSIPGMKRWEVTGAKFANLSVEADIMGMFGKLRWFRFANNDVTLEGLGWVDSPGVVSDINDLIRENVRIVGVGDLQ